MTTTVEERHQAERAYWSAFGHEPNETQAEILLDDRPIQLVAGGWRGGKSKTASFKGALATIDFIARFRERAAGQVAWIVANNYELTRAEFNYIGDFLRHAYPNVTSSTRVDPGYIRVPVPGGGIFEIKTKSASDPQTLAMEAPVWIIVAEAAQVSVDTFENLRGRCVEAQIRYPGFGWLHLEGTFEGSLGWYAAYWNKWQVSEFQSDDDAKSYSLPSHTNTILYPLGEEDPKWKKLIAETPPDLFSEKYLGIPVPPSGRVFKQFDKKLHVRDVAYDPDLPVYLGIDPGYSGQPSTYAVEVCQLYRFEDGTEQWRIFDEIAVNKHAMPGFTVKDVCDIAMSRYWWRNPDKKGVIDVAGEAHAGAQESNAEVWMKTTGMVLMSGKVMIQAGIDRFDTTLKVNPITNQPGVIIDPKCEMIISELGGGPNPFDGETHVYSWGTGNHGQVIGTTPVDKWCDGIKAFTYLDYHTRGAAFGNSSRKSIRVKSRRRR